MSACLMCPSCAESRALADRSARAAVDAARELGAVASQAREALRELLTATLARDTAHTAHTNAGPSMRRAAMDALTRAVEAAARVVDGTTTRAEVPRG